MRIETPTHTKCYILHIRGLVQGVGFRPFIFRLATEMDFNGWVENRNDGVFIKIKSSDEKVKLFEDKIRLQAPLASQIHSISVSETEDEYFEDFKIVKSADVSLEVTQVSPDIAVCCDCIEDMELQEHRLQYPFINCTNCGPRFSIINELPYDRPFTTMKSFTLCKICDEEYKNVLDRRFHAQPIACNHCGPEYKLIQKETEILPIGEIIDALVTGIGLGKVYAIKGIGGFHLMCDAQNETAVNRIRNIKNRDGKPFAIMASSADKIESIADINDKERQMLSAWQRPIVLLSYNDGLAAGVTNGLSRVGAMLPYMPFHYQLFKKLKLPYIVLTSGNISDEPIIIENEKAEAIFNEQVDGVLTYNRDIYNRVDDSVCIIINNEVRINRRSRGFAPQPIYTDLNTDGIFSAGAELANSFCMGKGNQAIMSQYMGDLKNIETLEFYEESYQRFKQLFRFNPQLIAVDLHPNYLSTQFAQKLCEEHQLPLVKIQHHHAHLASVMVSNKLDEDIIGVSFDGLGLGNDGNIWGAEFMVANLTDFERLYHFEYIPLPGGDKASKEPWRMAISYLFNVYGEELLNLKIPLLKAIDRSKILNTIQILKKKINTPQASSAGRLFDAVASLLGITHFNTFQAEGPMRLEVILDENEKGLYHYQLKNESISFHLMIKQIVEDYIQGKSPALISAKFHNTLVALVVDVVEKISTVKNMKNVVLSGGTFQNAYLTENIENRLKMRGFKVYFPQGIPVNDQGIALGQMAIAAKRRSLGII